MSFAIRSKSSNGRSPSLFYLLSTFFSLLLVILFAALSIAFFLKSQDDANEQKKKADDAKTLIPSLTIHLHGVLASAVATAVGVVISIFISFFFILLMAVRRPRVETSKWLGFKSGIFSFGIAYLLATSIVLTIWVSEKKATLSADDDVLTWLINEAVRAFKIHTAYKDYPNLVKATIFSWLTWFFLTVSGLLIVIRSANVRGSREPSGYVET